MITVNKSYEVAGFYLHNMDKIENILCSHCFYCAEPHQLNEDDLLDSVDYDDVVDEVSETFGATIEGADKEKFIEYLKDSLSDWFAEDPTNFYI